MDTFGKAKSKINPRSILGDMGFFDETGFENESFLSSAVKSIGGVIEDTVSLVKDEIVGSESKTEVPQAYIDAFKNEPEYKLDPTKFPSKGSIEFNQKQQAETNRKRDFFQSLKEDQNRVQREKDRLFEEEINDIVTNLPTEQKNRLLHYQASYKDKSIYQRAELRKKLIEERRNAEEQEKQASIPSPAKRPSAMEGAFEGGSGSQGSGTANLSAQAVG